MFPIPANSRKNIQGMCRHVWNLFYTETISISLVLILGSQRQFDARYTELCMNELIDHTHLMVCLKNKYSVSVNVCMISNITDNVYIHVYMFKE